MHPLTLLVVADPSARHLCLLERLPEDIHIVAGNRADIFEPAASEAGVLLNAMGSLETFRAVFRMCPRLRWVHSLTAGVENVLFPELIASPVPLTNSRGVFSRSLAEFVIGAALFFAKDFRRMVGSQQAGVWDCFDVDEIHGKLLGIVGYGDIGGTVAERARAFGMRVAAVRRRPELSRDDPLLDKVFAPAQIRDLLAMADYITLAAPLTPETLGLIGEAEFRAMRPSAVLINIGRGPVVVESVLVRALQEGWIRGAALDVFDTEPLPAGHAFYRLDNVLLSAHCADHTPGWVEAAMELFLENFERFLAGKPLLSLVDKKAGY